MGVIERNARSLERLVSDLLDVARIISGKLRLHTGRTALASVIQAAVEVVRNAADSKGVRLYLDLDPELGDIVADPDRLQQVVWNLVTNAVRFTPRGGQVAVTARRESSRVSIKVSDTGEGIAAEYLATVFERFRQIDGSITRSHGGLGLGLAIVRHLVDAHGGHVGVRSEGQGKGATFTVTLPIRAVDTCSVESFSADATKTLEPDAHRPAAFGAVLDGARVLVVEDDADALELVKSVLEVAGAQVNGCRSGSEALAATGRFDVIVSDIGMPGMDGYAFMRELRARDENADIPAVALTAYARAEDADRARRAGYQDHLAKPIDAAKLVETVRVWAKYGGA